MSDTPDQQKFAKSLRELAERMIADKPHMLRVRSVNDALKAEVRRRLAEGLPISVVCAIANESGHATLKEIGPDATIERAIDMLRREAAQAAVFAAGFCTLAKRIPPTGGLPVAVIQVHSEDRTGFAMVGGVAADEGDTTAGVTGIQGPAVGKYIKKVAPMIFVDTP
ncbi:MAG: hypothetical protein ACLQVG_20740 [Terriglobia bacterium]